MDCQPPRRRGGRARGDRRRPQIEPFTRRHAGFTVADAYAVTAKLRELSVARGEKPVGRKIGFTNRNIWAEYGVYQPIWGDDLRHARCATSTPGDRVACRNCPSRASSPRSCSGWRATSTPDMGDREIAQRVGWVAHGFEIVQSIFPGWRFQVADCVADGGLHGRLFVGPRRKLVGRQERRTLGCGPVRVSTIRLSKNGAAGRHGLGRECARRPDPGAGASGRGARRRTRTIRRSRRRDRHDGNADARLSGAIRRTLDDRDRRFRPARPVGRDRLRQLRGVQSVQLDIGGRHRTAHARKFACDLRLEGLGRIAVPR